MNREDYPQVMEEAVKDGPSPLSKFRKLSRPRLTIPTFNAESRHHHQGGSPVIQIPISAIPVADANGPFGVMHFYPSKASEYVNKRYEGFKDFTKNTAKSGLSFGEKFLFWLNGRVRHLSKKWFTHIFLLVVVMVYSLIGALLFVTVEGSHEESEKADLRKEFLLFANGVRNMAQEEGVVYDRELWLKKFKELMANYESQLLESFSRGVTPSEQKVWSFWNALFYCGTIYTTIVRISTMAEQVAADISVSDAGLGVTKKKVASGRLRKPQSRSPKRRACTPEPGRRAWTTDDSERDVSDVEAAKSPTNAAAAGTPKLVPRTRRLPRTSEKSIAARRTRSAERAPTADGDGDQDWDTIKSLHNSVKQEEEELEKRVHLDARRVSLVKKKSELMTVLPKEMPPLIEAPAQLRKLPRHKSITNEDCEPIHMAVMKPTMTADIRRKVEVSSSDEAEKGQEPVSSTRRRKIKGKDLKKVGKREVDKTDTSEFEEGRYSDRSRGEKESEEDGSEGELTAVKPVVEPPSSAQAKLGFFVNWLSRKSTAKTEPNEKNEKTPKVLEAQPEETKCEREKHQWFLSRVRAEWKLHVAQHAWQREKIHVLSNRCMSQLLLILVYCGLGGIIFRFTEGAFESFYKCGVKRVKRDFVDVLWGYSQYMREEEWKSQARHKLMDFENQLHAAHEAGMTTYSGRKSWSFLNAVVYSLTVITTIGYGHISPSTTTGRAITIIYAIFGIPMFLILLADFGKLFTRGIKFLWAFVRRLYYTGSCKKVRKTAPVQEMMKSVQLVYDFAKNRRPSQWSGDDQQDPNNRLRLPEGTAPAIPETPGTPNLSAFEIDDEFNLPISVAITILLVYIFVGATIYWMWEDWSFFESFYFVFISMSTIGFGDFVPQNPVYMMASIIYLVFGLALTSMCINVVQEKLTDEFRQASTKIGATIGLRVAEDGTLSAPAELADVNPTFHVK